MLGSTLALIALLAAGPSQGEAPVEAHGTAAAAGGPAPRCEWFLVREPDGDEVAAVRLLRLEAPGRTLLERDLVFRAEGHRIHHTELLEGPRRRLVWRELGPAGGTAWVADWDLADPSGGRQLRTVGHGWARATHGACSADAPWIGPLEWLEAARGGALAELGPVAWLTPGRATTGSAVYPTSAPRAFLASDALRGPEGACAAQGGGLQSFALLAPGRSATPCSAADYEAFVARHGYRPAPRHPYVEAALRRADTLRQLAEDGAWRLLLAP